MGYLLLGNILLHRLETSVPELPKLLICGIDGEQLSHRKSSEASFESVKAFILVIMDIHHLPHDQCSCRARFYS